MKKKYIIYQQSGKIKKAVLDENLYIKYKQNPEITLFEEFDNEMLMEQNYAAKVGKNFNDKKILFG